MPRYDKKELGIEMSDPVFGIGERMLEDCGNPTAFLILV